jgi:hypothetical protein
MLVSSVPLSLTIIAGQPRQAITASSSRPTRAPDNDVSATNAMHSRVKSSTTASIRKRRLSASVSLTKSSDHRWFAPAATPSEPVCPELFYVPRAGELCSRSSAGGCRHRIERPVWTSRRRPLGVAKRLCTLHASGFVTTAVYHSRGRFGRRSRSISRRAEAAGVSRAPSERVPTGGGICLPWRPRRVTSRLRHGAAVNRSPGSIGTFQAR